VRGLRVLKNVLTNYLRFFLGGLIGFLITPVMVHLLGDGSYGIWVLVASLTGYLGILDQGVRPSLVRYVSQYRAAGDEERLQATINTALVLYVGVGVATLAVAGGVAWQFGRFFRVDAGDLHAARIAVVLMGLSAALGFPLSVFGAVLSGLQRYDIANWIGIGVGVLRGVAFVAVLRLGGGLVELAWTSLLVTLLGHGLGVVGAFRLLPSLRLSLGRARREMVGRIASYSAYALLGAVAGNVIFQTDSIVITAFLTAAMVTPFALAAGLVDNARQLVYAATWVLSPTASEMDTRGETRALHDMLIAGSKYSTLLAWPVLFALVIFGQGLLVAWVGEKYAASARLLTILTVPTFLALPQSTAWAVLYGISKHRVPTVLNVANAAANLGLSILWVKPFGLAGVAYGTAVPLFVFGGVLIPLYACRVLRLSIWRYAREGLLVPGLVTLAFAAPAVLCEALWRPRGWPPLLGAIFGCWLLFAAVAWRVSLPVAERERWRRMSAGLWAEVRSLAGRPALDAGARPGEPR
jgi:O-antigen/teichoic acid export membrane protein